MCTINAMIEWVYLKTLIFEISFDNLDIVHIVNHITLSHQSNSLMCCWLSIKMHLPVKGKFQSPVYVCHWVKTVHAACQVAFITAPFYSASQSPLAEFTSPLRPQAVFTRCCFHTCTLSLVHKNTRFVIFTFDINNL